MSAGTVHQPTGDTRSTRLRQRLLDATPLTERHALLAGVSTAILEAGQGPPIVLLHGQGEFWGVWMPIVDDLARTHRVIVADLPGHGTSEVLDSPLDAAAATRWVDALIDATCDGEPPVLAGHLLGGAIAARYAVEHGARLSHLVLIDTLGLAWYRPSPRFAIPMVRFLARPTPRSRDRLFDKCMLDFDATGENFGDRWDDLRDYALEQARTDGNQAALRSLLPRVGIRPIPPEDLERIVTPTTLVHGRHDLQVPLRAAERASARHGWPLHVIEDARDDPAAEQPEALLAVLHHTLTPDHERLTPRRATMSAPSPAPTELRDAWDAVADGFDQHMTPRTMTMGQQIVDLLPLGPGVRVVDVGAGSGGLSVPAARTGAEVVAVDLSPTMVQRLRDRADAEGLGGLDARVGDGMALDLEDDSVDVAMSLNGVSLFPDLAGGLGELHRVTRPGGEVAVALFGPLPEVEPIAFFLGAIRAVAPDRLPPPTEPLPPFRLAQPGALPEALAAAGLRDVSVTDVVWEPSFASGDDLYDAILASNPIAGKLSAGLGPEQLAEARRILDGMLRERSEGANPATLRARVLVGRGTV